MTSQCVGELRSGIKGQPFCNAQSLRSTDQDTALVVFFFFKNMTVNKCEQTSATRSFLYLFSLVTLITYASLDN